MPSAYTYHKKSGSMKGSMQNYISIPNLLNQLFQLMNLNQ